MAQIVYQIKILLEGSKPPIWRRIEMNPETTLSDFHKIIQTSMGWMNGHLHHFIVDGEFYNPPSEWDEFGNDYTGIKVKDILVEEGQNIRYEYDFGDSWLHQIKLEKIKKKGEKVSYPRCIKGKRACPPEDCGGIWGYMELVQIMKNKKHESYEDMYEWLGRELTPEHFEIERVNDKLLKKIMGYLNMNSY
ncbi:MAG: plasmid pRiA4b ORF-3 family protein [Bacteroidota bacterium]